MKRKAIISLFRDTHFSCIEEFVKKNKNFAIITSNAYFSQIQKEILDKNKVEYIIIDEGPNESDLNLPDDAVKWLEIFINNSYSSSNNILGMPLVLLYIKQVLSIFSSLEKLYKYYDVKLCLFNDASLLFVKVFTEWSRKHNIKCIYVDHGAPYGEYLGNIYKHYVDEKIFADHIIVADKRSKETYVKLGIPDDSIEVLGSPAYEKHFEKSKNKKVLSVLSKNKLKIDKSRVTIGFATTWFASVSTKYDENVYYNTLSIFINALVILLNNDMKVNVLIKDRPQNYQYNSFLQNSIFELNEKYSGMLNINSSENLEDFLLASDIVISQNSTVLFEAIIYKKTAINIISLSSLFAVGDVHESELGIPEVQSYQELAEILYKLLSNNEFFINTQSYQYNYLINNYLKSYFYDGNVSSRIADYFDRLI